MAKATCEKQTAEPNRKANSQGAEGAPPAHEPCSSAPQGTERSETRHDAAGRRAQGNPNTRPESLGEPRHGQNRSNQTTPANQPDAAKPESLAAGRNAGRPKVAQAKGHRNVGKQLLTPDRSHFGASYWEPALARPFPLHSRIGNKGTTTPLRPQGVTASGLIAAELDEGATKSERPPGTDQTVWTSG